MTNGEQRISDLASWVMTILGALLGMILTIIFLGSNVAGWWTEIMAAWVQAAGVFAAIVVAVIVPWWQHHSEMAQAKHLRLLASLTLAVSILLGVKLFESHVSTISARTRILAEAQRKGGKVLMQHYANLKIDIPPYLESILRDLHLVEEAGASLAQAIGIARMYNDYCAESVGLRAILPADADRLSKQTEMVGKLLSDMDRELEPFHDVRP